MFNDHLHSSLTKNFELSKYATSLDNTAKSRYISKLEFEDEKGKYRIKDPYLISREEWHDNLKLWPNVEFGDVFIYLTSSPSAEYNVSTLKNYKSLAAYEYVHSGKVQTVYVHQLQNPKEHVVICADVQPLQRLSEDVFKPWVVLKTCGTVQTAHCTCIAGQETCSHIAALLFKVELAVRLGYTTTTPTDVAHIEDFEVVPLSEINFGKGRSTKRKINTPPQATPLSTKEIAALRRIKPDAVFFTAFHDSSSTDTASEDEELLILALATS